MKQFTETLLLTSDQNSSVLSSGANRQRRSYTPFGFIQRSGNNDSTLAFNGQPLEALSDQYLLGNGYRAYNPILMRFGSPDSYSPFAAGGINCYVYVGNEPVRSTDPSGHAPQDTAKKLIGILNKPNSPITLSSRTMRKLWRFEHALKETPAALEIFAHSASRLNLYESALVNASNALKTPRSADLLPVPKTLADEINKHRYFSEPTRFQELSGLALEKSHPDSTAASKILQETDDSVRLINHKPERSFSEAHMKLYNEYYDRLVSRPHLLTSHSKSRSNIRLN